MTDSFVFYRSFHEALKDLPLEEYGAIMFAINEYALNGVEPELSGAIKMAFTLIKPQIDANNYRKEAGQKGAEFGRLGGRPKKKTENPIGVIDGNPIGVFEETPNVNLNENVNDNGNLNANGNEAALPPFPPLSPNDEEIAKKAKEIFNAFQTAGLPCCNGNYLTFIQRDFKTALQFLRGYTAEEVIAAVQNYASIFQRRDLDAFWQKQKVRFDKFAERKIKDFIPGNFDLGRYLNAKEKKLGAL